MTTDLNAIKDRIAKLLAKAEKTDNIHEAAAFMAGVNRLLEEYQLEMFEIRAHSPNGPNYDPMGDQKGEFNIYASMTWAKLVTHYVAKYYGARVIWEGRDGPKRNHLPYRIFGVQSARVTAELMIPYVVSQVRQQARMYKGDHPWTYDHKAMTDSIAQREVGTALCTRIQSLLAGVDARRADLESRALVPVDTTQDFIDQFYGGTLRTGRGSKKGYSANAAGYADKISLNHQATGVGRKQIAGA